MENQEMRKSSYWKFVGAFIGIILVVVIGFIAWKAYEIQRDRQTIKNVADALKQAEGDAIRRAMADTYGGKTPQETLAMYIDAVEKGDYELASKYFIGDYQAKELEKLQNSPSENTKKVVELLKTDLKSEGSFSEDQKSFGIRKPLFVNFKLYPSGIWKIIEI